MTFAHLQIRSGYSLMSSTVQVPKLIEHAKQLNFTALALTDEGVLHNVIPFYKACKEHGIKPVIGLVLPIIHEEMELEIVLLAKNNLGYQQLLSLSTQLHLTGSITLEDL